MEEKDDVLWSMGYGFIAMLEDATDISFKVNKEV
jgi:hypothetical protein